MSKQFFNNLPVCLCVCYQFFAFYCIWTGSQDFNPRSPLGIAKFPIVKNVLWQLEDAKCTVFERHNANLIDWFVM
jgi:hypothetical protein